MAPNKTIRQIYICHFCSVEHTDRSSLISHLTECQTVEPPLEKVRSPRLTKIDQEILRILKLRRSNNRPRRSKPTTRRTDKKQNLPSFHDECCSTNDASSIDFESSENERANGIVLNNKSIPYHFYKYSRRERANFYASVKRARPKKISTKKMVQESLKIDRGPFHIHLPTKINARQSLKNDSKNLFPLLFDPNFDSLVRISTDVKLKNYSTTIENYFHMIHSIASQEFQLIVHSHDSPHSPISNGFSFLQILRQTMWNYSISLQKSYRTDYFRAFQTQLPPAPIEHQSQPEKQLNLGETDSSIKVSSTAEIEQKSNECVAQLSPPVKEIKKPTRIQTRRSENTIKTEQNRSISLETKPIHLSANEISEQWSKNNIFYRCHACSHEEFFVVLSRECLNLHLSSEHGNMEENFKQRVSNFLNKQGRSLKIFQHYLKWQQPWSENEIENIFHLSNSHSRTTRPR